MNLVQSIYEKFYPPEKTELQIALEDFKNFDPEEFEIAFFLCAPLELLEYPKEAERLCKKLIKREITILTRRCKTAWLREKIDLQKCPKNRLSH